MTVSAAAVDISCLPDLVTAPLSSETSFATSTTVEKNRQLSLESGIISLRVEPLEELIDDMCIESSADGCMLRASVIRSEEEEVVCPTDGETNIINNEHHHPLSDIECDGVNTETVLEEKAETGPKLQIKVQQLQVVSKPSNLMSASSFLSGTK
jgi:hypothetical protein